ncbi:MAG: transcriptional regulator, LacI family [Clostridiales bacterium]|nr:transcriptional regulator, LacI family [Clostridiales bacterium]
MVTQDDIAKNLNISRTTVARALRGKFVSDDTRKMVLEEAKRLGYIKNSVAASLALKKGKTIYAFVVATVDEDYGKQMHEGIQEISAIWSGYNFKINTIFTDITKKDNQCKVQLQQFYDVLENQHIDGVIFSALSKQNMESVTEECRKRKIPLMTLDMIYTDSSLCHVGPNYYMLGTYSAAFMANLMMERGKILTFTYDEGYELGIHRMRGFHDKLKEYENISYRNVVLDNMSYDSYSKVLEENYEEFQPIAIYAPYHVDYIGQFLNKCGLQNKVILISNGVNKNVENYLFDGTINGVVSARPHFLGSVAAYNFFKYFYRSTEMKTGTIDILCDIYIKENYRRNDDLF